jgi:hypothetical protein
VLSAEDGSSGGEVEALNRRIAELEAELKKVRAERDRWESTLHLTLFDLAGVVPPGRLRIVEPSDQSIPEIVAEFERQLGDDDDSDSPGPVPV